MTILYPILQITILYFLFAFLSGSIKKLIGKKICAICAAVSLTWLSLLILWLAGFNIDPLVIAVLMGQSIVGIMYQTEEYFEQKKLKKFWLVRILIITLGTLSVYLLLKKIWFSFLVVVLISLVLALILWLVILKGKGKKEKIEKTNKAFGNAVSDLEKKLEDCC